MPTPRKKQRHYLDIVYNKSLLLEKLVRNMSDFSEYELGRMQYHFEYVEMGPFLGDLSEEYQADVGRNGMSFTSQIPRGTMWSQPTGASSSGCWITSSPTPSNMAGPRGEIALVAEEYEKGLVIQVSDNGKGISTQAPPPRVRKLFPGRQRPHQPVPGSGLGLAICRSIVDSHHGKIWLTSEEERAPGPLSIFPCRRRRECCDENFDYRRRPERGRAGAGLPGDQRRLSVRPVQQRHPGPPGGPDGDYALVIVDVMLPGLSGFEICRRLREEKDTPVIIISALADDIDKVRGLGLGADDYMTKPFSPSELVARVKGHIQRYERLVGSREKPRPEILKIRGLEIDRESRRVWVNERRPA